MWHTGSGSETNVEFIMEEVSSHMKKAGLIFIGCDSQITRDQCTFSTVVCLHGAEGQKGRILLFPERKEE